MGIDMVLRLVSYSNLSELLSMQVGSLVSALESSALPRPEGDKRLERSFDIDAAAELLDWFEENHVPKDSELLPALQNIGLNAACECLYLCAQWASPGHWEAWEGRCFIYLETLVGYSVEHVDDLYSSSLWKDVTASSHGFTEKEFSEAVVLNWMNRREEIDATLDQNADPHILPTMGAHQRNAKTLHHLLSKVPDEDNFLLLGREHLSAEKWGLDDVNLAHILNHGL